MDGDLLEEVCGLPMCFQSVSKVFPNPRRSTPITCKWISKEIKRGNTQVTTWVGISPPDLRFGWIRISPDFSFEVGPQ